MTTEPIKMPLEVAFSALFLSKSASIVVVLVYSTLVIDNRFS